MQINAQGGDKFFGEPMLDIADFMQTAAAPGASSGKQQGVINILAADKLLTSPRLYATFLLWMLSELYEHLPEVGDLDKPKLVFFFDEAHLLFDDAPPALRQRVEQVVRLIRSKGVGVYFCSQNPDDVPDVILGQMGNRIQHALRAFTPRDQKAVKAAAETFAPNPKVKVVDVITQLAVGEALVSTLMEGGVPMPVERAMIVSPGCRIGAITPDERAAIRARSPVGGKYDTAIDRESAFEKLGAGQAGGTGKAGPAGGAGQATGSTITDTLSAILLGTTGPRGGHHDGLVESAAKSAARSMGSGLGRAILRGALGSILGGSTRRSR
jgi:DNA helicase HerA-like ATPase